MLIKFKKKELIGVSISVEHGLECAQIDLENKKVINYCSRPIAYDSLRYTVADFDIFKDTLQDILSNMQIPLGSEIAITIPTTLFKVDSYSAAMNLTEIQANIEEELIEDQRFQNLDMSVSAAILPNSNIQFNRTAATIARRDFLIELAMYIKELGYKLVSIDTSVNAVLNSMLYLDMIDTSSSESWVLLLVENDSCRVISMQGKTYVDCVEERINIASILGEDENYQTVLSTVAPILKNVPSKYLCVLSKTDIISAQNLASKLNYSAPIIYQEANIYKEGAFLQADTEDLNEAVKELSLDAIGAAINRDFMEFSNAPLNLYNSSLGDIYNQEQPMTIKLGQRTVTLSIEYAVNVALFIALLLFIPLVIAFVILSQGIANSNAQVDKLETEISSINKFLKDNETISSELFDEGDEIRIGLIRNKRIYSYYTILGTEIPRKLWLTSVILGEKVTINGRADNIESIYSFYRNIKDYDPNSAIKLQKLGLATGSISKKIANAETKDINSFLTSLNADFYQFSISDENAKEVQDEEINDNNTSKNKQPDKNKTDKKKSKSTVPLEPIKETN